MEKHDRRNSGWISCERNHAWKNTLKTHTKGTIEAKINENITLENEAEAKTKVKYWRERRQDAKVGARPKYMDQLTRKQCNAIESTEKGASMIMVKANYKKGNDNNLDCRMEPETQEHITQECPEIGSQHYGKIMMQEWEHLERWNKLPKRKRWTHHHHHHRRHHHHYRHYYYQKVPYPNWEVPYQNFYLK